MILFLARMLKGSELTTCKFFLYKKKLFQNVLTTFIFAYFLLFTLNLQLFSQMFSLVRMEKTSFCLQSSRFDIFTVVVYEQFKKLKFKEKNCFSSGMLK